MTRQDADTQVLKAWQRLRAQVIGILPELAMIDPEREQDLRRSFCMELYHAALTPTRDASSLASAAHRLANARPDKVLKRMITP